MKLNITILILLLIQTSFSFNSFKDEQKKYPRVRQAYIDKELIIIDLLERNSIDINKLQIYIQVFKLEKKLELWAKNKSDNSHKLIREYDICDTSGKLGPKRMQGDLQIPEGFYHIDRFNPHSNFYLSLGINYPNNSDRILGYKNNLGGDIFIHGDSVTIGCLPITDDKIKELYVFCIEAKDKGQINIPVTIFPTKLNDTNYNELKIKYRLDNDKLLLWSELKQIYDFFKEKKYLPRVIFLNDGRHRIN